MIGDIIYFILRKRNVVNELVNMAFMSFVGIKAVKIGGKYKVSEENLKKFINGEEQ